MAKTVSLIFGTRPEAIKLCPLIGALRAHPDFDPHVCVTGQHREMLEDVLSVFEIVPDVDLRLMRADQSLSSLTARAMEAIDRYLAEHKPDLVLVQGDTTSVFCAALAAYYHRIPVGHVEAGLRTGDPFSPYPEEINRVLTTHLAAYHFAPTETAKANLVKEGVPERHIHVTGNTVIDALHIAADKIKHDPPAIPGLPTDETDRPLVLITGHRRENFGRPFEAICRAIAELARRFPQTRFVYPVHLNPNVREPVHRVLSDFDNVYLIEPLNYLAFVAVMNAATLILTDSGGVQEEAPSLGTPVLVLRDTTERPEALDAGMVKLVGTDPVTIVDAASQLLTDPAAYTVMARAAKGKNPYGDGQACRRIMAILAEHS